jgi:hypothetical protein
MGTMGVWKTALSIQADPILLSVRAHVCGLHVRVLGALVCASLLATRASVVSAVLIRYLCGDLCRDPVSRLWKPGFSTIDGIP